MDFDMGNCKTWTLNSGLDYGLDYNYHSCQPSRLDSPGFGGSVPDPKIYLDSLVGQPLHD